MRRKPARQQPPPPSGTGAPPVGARNAGRDAAALREEVTQLRQTVEALYARQSLLEAVIDSLSVWISVKDRQGRYLLVNDALVKAHGATRADFLGKLTPQSRELSPGGLAAMAEADRAVLATGEPVHRPRYTVRLPDGRQRIRSLTKLPLRDDEGEMLGVVGWSEDVTERVLAEDALAAQRGVLRAVIDVVPYPLSYIDTAGHLLMVNSAWCEAMGTTQADVEGRTVLELEQLPLEARQRLYEDNVAIFSRGEVPPPREYAMPDAKGTVRDAIVSKAVVRGPAGAVEGVVTVAVDITDLRAAEQRATRAHQRLVDAMESMPAGLQLYDAQGRIEYANSVMGDYFPHTAGLWQRPGTSFQDLVRHSVEDLGLEGPERARYVKRRLAEFRDPPPAVDFLLADGRHILGHDRRMRDGSTISIRVDITEQKRIQQALEQREREMQADLALAAELQRSILQPLDAPPYLAAALHFQPCSPVSGDLYHARGGAEGPFHTFIGDATGHGVAAAFMSLLVQAALGSLEGALHPADALAQLNTRLCGYELGGRFVSGICVRIDKDGTLCVANAGHPPLVVLPRGGAQPVVLQAGGLPLGWFAGKDYPAETYRLERGDRVLLYTDGLTEWHDAGGAEFGTDALLEAAWRHRRSTPRRLVERILAAAREATGAEAAQDDLTLLVLEYRGARTR